MPEYLLISQRVIRCEICFQSATLEEARMLATTGAALDITAFSQVNATVDLYEADVTLTSEQIQAAIAELITCFGYENITECILAKPQETIAKRLSEEYQDPEYLCVLYKEAAGPFYCHSSQQLVLKLMEERERASHVLQTPPDPCLDEVRFAGNVGDYDHLKTREFQGKTYIAVAKN